MNEIKCPKCGEVFQVDAAGYAAIVKQVRDKEFAKEIGERREAFEKQMDDAVRIAVADREAALRGELSAMDAKVAELNARLEAAGGERDHAVASAVSERDTKIAELNARLEAAGGERDHAVASAVSERDTKIAELTARLEAADGDKKNALALLDAEHKQKMTELNARIEASSSEHEIRSSEMQKTFDAMLKMKEDEIEKLKDFKARLSTKMIGETLERHCEIEFEKVRAMGFQTAKFYKDNDARSGSKGDYIFRDFDENGDPYISIMFEMKNEMDTTSTKKRNSDFFKELDKDRKQKGCEYAVLVSMLEEDNELYSGITDVSSGEYEKMYVVRPQFFVPIITILRNAARSTLESRRELADIKSRNVDITKFEEKLERFRGTIKSNYDKAGKHYSNAIEEINKTIKALEKTRDELEKSLQDLARANTSAEDLTIKKLTHGNPTMKAMFASLPKESEGREEDDDGPL